MKIHIIDKLFIGFFAYSKNFYSESYSADNGAQLLGVCLAFGSVPIFFTLSELVFGNNPSLQIIKISSGLICMCSCYFFPLFYYTLSKRGKNLIDLYRTKTPTEIKKLKRISGYTAISVSFFLFCFIIGSMFYFQKP